MVETHLGQEEAHQMEVEVHQVGELWLQWGYQAYRGVRVCPAAKL
jgi:hypothetical protein